MGRPAVITPIRQWFAIIVQWFATIVAIRHGSDRQNALEGTAAPKSVILLCAITARGPTVRCAVPILASPISSRSFAVATQGNYHGRQKHSFKA